MEKNFRISIEKFNSITALFISFIITSIFTIFFGEKKFNINFFLVLVIWLAMVLYYLQDIKKNSALLLFLLSFFVLLIGREFVFAYSGVTRYYLYGEDIDNKTYIILYISLICLFIGSKLASSVDFGVNNVKLKYGSNYNKLIKYIFFITTVSTVLWNIIKFRAISKIGYVKSFSQGLNLSGGPLMYLANFSFMSFCLYLSLMEDKGKTFRAIYFYMVTLITSLLTGGRATFILGCVVVAIYIFIRQKNEGGWISKRFVWIGILLTPFLLVFLLVFDDIRSKNDVEIKDNALVSFLDQQGGSVNNIKRVMYWEDELLDMKLVSFNSTKSQLTENFLVRNIFDVKVNNNNSVKKALEGNSLAHRLSYYNYGNLYLQGRGTGSSYIAEVYFDFGIVGVMLANVLYGFLLYKISNIDKKGFKTAILLFISAYIIYAPRDSFDAFISNLLPIYIIAGILFIFAITNTKIIINKGE